MKKRRAVYFSGNLIMDSLEYFGYPAQKMGKQYSYRIPYCYLHHKFIR